MTMTEDPALALADFFGSLDPDSIFRAIALSCAENRVPRDRTHESVMAVAEAYLEFIDPLAIEQGRITVNLGKK